jgi:segregation and condensation protein A
MSNDFYELDLDSSYTGPLDLLYLLMREEEIPFEKISIAKIADQYLEFIKDMEEIDLSYAGDFLDLASRLMALKARELLPKDGQSKEDLLDFEIEREALIRQMEEYQKFKRVALGLKELEDENFGTYGRGRIERISKDSQLADADIWQLFKAFSKALQAHTYENRVHTIEVDKVLIEDRQQHINTYLSQRGRAMFDDLIGKERVPIMIAVTFMATLELTKTDDIVFRQSEVNGPLWLYRKKQNDEYKEELALEKIYYTPNPNVQPGLVDYLHGRSHALEMKEKSSLDSILKTAIQLIESGINIGETDVQAMLEGTMPKC